MWARMRRAWRELREQLPKGPRHETWTCPICGRPVEMPSGGSRLQRAGGYYLPPGAPEIKLACAKQHGTRHGKFEESDLGMPGLEKRLKVMHDWLEHPPAPGEVGCEFCRDDENRLYGHMTPLASNDDTQMLLLRCPRCGTLYENNARGPDVTQRLTEHEAHEHFPGAWLSQ